MFLTSITKWKYNDKGLRVMKLSLENINFDLVLINLRKFC